MFTGFMSSLTRARVCVALLVLTGAAPAYAFEPDWPPTLFEDPFDVEADIAPYGKGLSPDVCPDVPEADKALSLIDVVNLALCHNPDTRLAWLSLRQSALSLGSSKTALLPTLSADANLGTVRTQTNGGSFITRSSGADIALSYTLFDFGKRSATIEAAEQSLIASGFGHNATLQGAIATALQTYYQLLTAQSSVAVAHETERFAKESLDAATTRHTLGLVPLSDVLQGRASYSQAQLTTEQAVNQLALARSNLANLLGLPPQRDVKVAEIDDSLLLNEHITHQVEPLMERAKQLRPDLAAQAASLAASRATLHAARRADYPSLSLSAGQSFSDVDVFNRDTSRSGTIGLSVSIPIFTGFARPYTIRSAETSLEAAEITYEKTQLSIMQDVFRSYTNYETAQQTWITSWDLTASATELRDITLGRYKQGLGSMLDVLNAQSQYASALQQQTNSRYNLLTTRADLMRAAGLLTLDTVRPDAPLPSTLKPASGEQ